MKNGDCIKAFVQIGCMKKPRWIVGKVMDTNFPEDGVLVEIYNNFHWVDRNKVKLYKRMAYDSKNYLWQDVVNFSNKNWESLKKNIYKAKSQFFPNIDIEVDEKDHIIYAMSKTVSIGAEVHEVESLDCFEEVAAWGVQIWSEIPATQWEPPDVDSTHYEVSMNTQRAAKAFINAIWQVMQNNYWDNESYDDYAECA